MHRRGPKALLVVALTGGVYILDVSIGLLPDVSGLFLVPVVLSAYWFGLLPSLAVTAIALSADFVQHPVVPGYVVLVHSVTHLMTYSFAAYVTSLLRNQLATIRRLSSRRDYELDLAKRLQDALAERYMVTTGDPHDMAVKSVSSRELGGDQVLVRSTEQGLFGCIADISGKGVSAALFAPLLQSLIHEAIEFSADPHTVIAKVNAGMHASLPQDMFVTMFCCLVEANKLTFVNAGHEPGFLIDGDGVMRQLMSKGGLPVGVMAQLSVPPDTCDFESGSVLLGYSDGITDSAGFGGNQEQIAAFLRSTRSETADEIAERLLLQASEGGDAQNDDMSVLVIRAL